MLKLVFYRSVLSFEFSLNLNILGFFYGEALSTDWLLYFSFSLYVLELVSLVLGYLIFMYDRYF